MTKMNQQQSSPGFSVTIIEFSSIKLSQYKRLIRKGRSFYM